MSEKNRPLVHCHLHTSFSHLDGCGKMDDYIEKAKQNNHPAISITDHGNPAGLFDFYNKCRENDIKPILGEEFYMTTDIGHRIPNKQRDIYTRDKHQSVLIKNTNGYKNFNKLTYLSYTEGFYFKPRIDYDMLFENANGLIITSGCAATIFNQLLSGGEKKEAEEWFKKFVNKFGDDFYGEIQFNELTGGEYDIDQKVINDFIIEMSNKYDVPLLIGGDVHYAESGDQRLQDLVVNISRGGNSDFFVHARNLYYHTSEDYYRMNKEFGYNYDESIITQALDNSLEMKDKVNFEFDTDSINFPKYKPEIKDNRTNYDILRDMAYEGAYNTIKYRKSLGEKFSNELIDKYKDRIEKELDVFNKKNVIDYFLVYQDLTNWARKNGIYVGPGRGSAAGCLISYLIGITNIDPIKHNLLFERFQNLARQSLPDIDSDFTQGDREKIRKYLEQTYGEDSVLGVSTQILYHPRSALQDAARGLGKDTGFESVLMKEIVELPDLDDAKDLEEYFSNILTKDNISKNVEKWVEENEDVIIWANKLLYQCKTMSTHAGGILVTPGPVYDYIPVTRAAKEVVTAFRESDLSSKDLSELGLLKLDILGLKTLNVIRDCVNDIKNDTGKDISKDIEDVDLEDEKLYWLLRQGNNIGIFQMDNCDDLIENIYPETFQDVSATSAINRPGPKEMFGGKYGNWKKWIQNGEEHKCKEDDLYPKLDFMKDITKETFGCCVYQEQIMQMVAHAGNYSLGETDVIRKLLGSKKEKDKEKLDKELDNIRERMESLGYNNEDIEYFLKYVKDYSGYSFNQSHSVSYSYITMQTLYLKYYYPEYFFAHLLNYEDRDDYQVIVSNAISNGIDILPPSVIKSGYNCSVEDGKIRIGLKIIKGLGDTAYKELDSMGFDENTKIEDVFGRKYKKLNKKSFEALIKVGAFDDFGVERGKLHKLRELYNDEGIKKWFTYKQEKNRLSFEKLPKSLYYVSETELFEVVEDLKNMSVDDKPWFELINRLIPHIPYDEISEYKNEDDQEDILGFNIKHSERVRKIEDKIAKSGIDVKPSSDWGSENDLCYWLVMSIERKKSKKGNIYLKMRVFDKRGIHNALCFKDLPIKKGEGYVSRLNKDNFGLKIVYDELLTKILDRNV